MPIKGRERKQTESESVSAPSRTEHKALATQIIMETNANDFSENA
jgi:hypothetical protein